MKKVLMMIGILMASIMFISAQCVEVKNVETQKVEPKVEKRRMYIKDERGFEFNNLNDYTVTVEAEIRMTSHEYSNPGVSYFTLDAKTFVVHAKEKYFWVPDLYVREKMFYGHTFVVFKAFKCQ
jgi:hypothetical protein